MAVMLVTSVGDLVIDLFTDQCPLTTKNFLKLCKIKYYNNCLFHSVQKDFIVQTGDPTGTGKGGDSVYKLLYGDQARFFEDEIRPNLKHDKVGIVAMASAGENANASQFYITTRAELDYLDEKHTVFGEVGEGLEALMRINEAFVDDNFRPYKNIRIKHSIILEDPFDDPAGLADLIPDKSPELKPPAQGEEVRLEDDWVPMDETMDPEELEKSLRQKEAQSRAVVLEMIGDLPEADMKPPENVLFVCKLNPVTEEGDLDLIFSRFGKVKSADIIRDYKTGDSLCYAFIEFETEEACEAAYFKMDNVLIDDRRIHVDFSQSVSQLWNRYRKFGKAGGDGQPANQGKGCFKCGEVGHYAKECPNDGAEEKDGPTEKPKYTIKETGGQRGNINKRYDMVFAEDENPADQRASDRSRRGRKDTDSHHRESERPRADGHTNKRNERDSRRDRDSERHTDTRRRPDRDMDRRKESRREYTPEPRAERDGSRPSKASPPSKPEYSRQGRAYPDEIKESSRHDLRRGRRDDEPEPRSHGEHRRPKRSEREASEDSAGGFRKASGRSSRDVSRGDDRRRDERDDGRREERDDRRREGRDDGRREGRDDGRREGRDDGRREGRDGRGNGRSDGRDDMHSKKRRS